MALTSCGSSPERPQRPATGYLSGYIPSESRLQDYSAGKVHDMLAAPSLVRREEHVEIWQYTSERCAADFYFDAGDGRNADTRDMPMLHYDIRAKEADASMAYDECLGSVIQEHNRRLVR